MMIPRILTRAAALLLLSAAFAMLAGCASMEANSDQPWATQESWEGSVVLPGFRD